MLDARLLGLLLDKSSKPFIEMIEPRSSLKLQAAWKFIKKPR